MDTKVPVGPSVSLLFFCCVQLVFLTADATDPPWSQTHQYMLGWDIKEATFSAKGTVSTDIPTGSLIIGKL